MAVLALAPLPSGWPPSSASTPSYAPSGFPPSAAWLAAPGSLHAQVSLPQRPDPPSLSPSTLALPVRSVTPPPSRSALSSASRPPDVVNHNICGACGNILLPGSKFCRICGTQGSQVCACGNVLKPDSRFCPICGLQRPVLLPQTLPGSLAPFGAQSVQVAAPGGVPNAIYEGVEACDEGEAHAVSGFKLDRQLEVEATMDGIVDNHMPKMVHHVQVDSEHFSNQPDWSRREWIHDPFYGWRTQEESKIPPVLAVKKAAEAKRRAEIEARKDHAHLLAVRDAHAKDEFQEGTAVSLVQDPFMTTPHAQPELSTTSILEALRPTLRPRPLDQPRKPAEVGAGIGPPSMAIGAALQTPVEPTRPGAPRPSWHDAEIRERILAASHMSGNYLAQPEAVKQRAIIDYDLPVHAFVGDAPERAGGPAPSVALGTAAHVGDAAPSQQTAESDPARSWTSIFSVSRPSELAARPAGSKASTATTRIPDDPVPNPYENFHSVPHPDDQIATRPLDVGPAFAPPPGPLWFLGM